MTYDSLSSVFNINTATVRGVHSEHTEYAVRGADSKDKFITTAFTNFYCKQCKLLTLIT